MKKIKFAEPVKYIQALKNQGYTYLIMPARKRKVFYATKASQKKDGTFRDNSRFDKYTLTETEVWPFDKGCFINLQA